MPQLGTEALRPNWSVDQGTVVIDQNLVVAVSPAAIAAGVQQGMRSSSVHMLLPESELKQYDAEKESAALQKVAMSLLHYSPQVASAEQASLLINIGASVRLFGGVRRLRRHVLASMATLGITVKLGYAPTARAAWLFAHSVQATQRNGKYCLSPDKLSRHLDALPVSLLPAALPWREWLEGIGCHTAGHLRALPRAGIQRRCGKALLSNLDCAYGDATELYQWLEIPQQFTARSELPDRIEQADALLHFARGLLLQLSGWLHHQHLAVSKIQLLLEHERGRFAIAPTRIDISLAEPTWQEEHLTRLLKERLAQITLEAPVITLSLHAAETEPMQAPNSSLFPEPGGAGPEQHKLLELLVARLGPENVLQAAPQADYRPEVANRWVSVMHPDKHSGRSGDLPAMQPPPGMMNRPAWLLPQAIALKLRHHRPFYGSVLKILSPPERIESGWWSDPLVTRDYFIAENAEHVRCWIYRERLSASGPTVMNGSAADSDADGRWFLHGWFG